MRRIICRPSVSKPDSAAILQQSWRTIRKVTLQSGRNVRRSHFMSTSLEHRDLGMDRRIDRRDFLNGVAVGIGGAYAALKGVPVLSTQQPGARPADYPPPRPGL